MNGLPHRTIIIISDNDKLARALELNLLSYGSTLSLKLGAPPRSLPPAAINPDLIIIALSAPDSEPLVALARAALGQYLGRIPVLVISDREFTTGPGESIGYLHFPFSTEALRRAVHELLTTTPAEESRDTP